MEAKDVKRLDAISAALHHLSKGKIPNFLKTSGQSIDEINQVSEYVNKLIADQELLLQETMYISNGELSSEIKTALPAANGLKSLQASIKHLTWQTKQIANGDFNQRLLLGQLAQMVAEIVIQLSAFVDQIASLYFIQQRHACGTSNRIAAEGAEQVNLMGKAIQQFTTGDHNTRRKTIGHRFAHGNKVHLFQPLGFKAPHVTEKFNDKPRKFFLSGAFVLLCGSNTIWLTIGQNCPNINFVKARALIRKLKKHGVEFIKDRGKGGHQLARYRGKQTTIPMHGDADMGPQFVKTLCKQLGINPDDIL